MRNGRCAFRRNADAVYIRYQGSSAGVFYDLQSGSEKISYRKLRRFYLAACETIDANIHSPLQSGHDLTVHLQSNENNLHYPDRDLRLSRWDKSRFAEAVVDFVLHDMISSEDRLRLPSSPCAGWGNRESV